MQEMAVTTASPDSLDLAVEIRKLLEGFNHDGLSYKVAQVGSFGFTEYVHFVCMLPTKETVFDFEVEFYLERLVQVIHPPTRAGYDGSWHDQEYQAGFPGELGVPGTLMPLVEELWDGLTKLCNTPTP